MRGSREYRRLTAALWLAGAGTFVLVYCAQALLPMFSSSFEVSPAASALTLSVSTGALALAVLPISAVADSWGRKRVMTVSLTVTALLGLLAPFAPTFEALLAVRAVQGLAMAGVPALAMAHLSEEVHPSSLGGAMGLLIAGNTVGGLTGRLVASAVADLAGWRVALAVIGGISLGCLLGFRALLPPATAARPVAERPRALLGHLIAHLRDPGLRLLCLISFLMMSAFVSVYNFLGYRLLQAPFGLSATLAGLAFVAYVAGTWASPLAGRLGDRFGSRTVLPLGVLTAVAAALTTLPDVLPLVLAGLVLFTVGFFGAHSIASGWVGRRAARARAQASALYLFSYYAGSSVGGVVGGLAYEAGQWPGLVAYVVALLLLALLLALVLRRIPPTPTATAAEDTPQQPMVRQP